MITKNDIILTLTELRAARRIAKKQLERSPEGALVIIDSSRGKKYRQVVYSDSGKHQRGIGLMPRLIYDLANKGYLESKIKILDEDINALEQILAKYKDVDENSIITGLPKNYRFLNPELIVDPDRTEQTGYRPNPCSDGSICPKQIAGDIGSQSPFEWGIQPYCENTFYAENKRIISACGLAVRSKSELAILNVYQNKGIYFHYDELLFIGNDRISPDFFCVRNDGTLFIHEHVGLFDTAYRKRLEYKIHRYAEAGFEQGRNLLLTFDREDGSVNLGLIEHLIDDMFACRSVLSE